MRTAVIFVVFAIFSFLAFFFLSYMDQMFLGILLAVIIILWPTAYTVISHIAEKNIFRPKEEAKKFKQDIIDGKEEHTEPETKKEVGEEFVVPPKKDEDVKKIKEDLEKLKSASEFLDVELKEGVLSEDACKELKEKNKEAIEKLEQEIAKASGEVKERMIYCRKGKHYISERDCIPSKIKGYVICQEHNEEIRIE